MTKKIHSIKLHLSITREMLAFYCKEKRWASLPGLIIWSMLPLFVILFGISLIAFIGWQLS